MSTPLITSLPPLKRHSGVSISSSVVHGMSAGSSGGYDLARLTHQSGEYLLVPRNGVQSVNSNLQSKRKLMTLDSHRRGFMRSVNEGLKGGPSYPVLVFALGTAVGVASGGAGLIFGATTLMVDLGRRETDVLARKGDELWRVEEIGRVYENNTFSADRWIGMHITSYFLLDPFRSQGNNPDKGWLINEDRRRLLLDDDV